MSPLPLDPETEARRRLVDEFAVSRETLEKLEHYVDALTLWQQRINLVSPSTLTEIWERHILDCAQLGALAPSSARVWADLGSGAGLPGLVLAIIAASRVPLFHMHLLESNAKKCAFLRHVSTGLALPVTVHCARIEAVIATIWPLHVVTGRALAPLSNLIGLSESALRRGAVGLFPKGKGYANELTEAQKIWKIHSSLTDSVTDPQARIVSVRLAGHPVADGSVRIE